MLEPRLAYGTMPACAPRIPLRYPRQPPRPRGGPGRPPTQGAMEDLGRESLVEFHRDAYDVAAAAPPGGPPASPANFAEIFERSEPAADAGVSSDRLLDPGGHPGPRDGAMHLRRPIARPALCAGGPRRAALMAREGGP